MDASITVLLVRLHFDTATITTEVGEFGSKTKRSKWGFFKSLFLLDGGFLVDSIGAPWSHCYALGTLSLAWASRKLI